MSQGKPKGIARLGWHVVRFLLHLAAIYFIAKFFTLWFAGWTWNTWLMVLQRPPSSNLVFAFSHIFIFSFVPAFLAGLVNGRFKQKEALFVWLVPAVILAYKFTTFSTVASVLQSQNQGLQSQFSSAFHEFFGGGFQMWEFHDWREFWSIAPSNYSDMTRGMVQLTFTAPFYAGVGYSVGAWIALRTELHRKIVEKVKKWEEWKFDHRS